MSDKLLFSNCLIQAPDGVNLSRCGLKKLRWYINNGLADLVSDSPPTIKLRFEPSGRRGLEDPLLMDGKPNHCVVCGTTDNLTRHHIIPYSFIRYMPIEYKVDIIRDIFPLCRPCHNDYEKKSQDKRHEMSDRLGVPLYGLEDDTLHKIRKATGAAVTLHRYGNVIPDARKQELLNFVRVFLGKQEVTEADLNDVRNHRISQRDDYINFSKYVAANMGDYNNFAKEWRLHFVESMNPQFMPTKWSVNRQTKDVWVPKRMLTQRIRE